MDTNAKLDLMELKNSAGYLLRRADKVLREQTLPALAELSLSSLEGTTLYLVRENPDCTLRRLAEAVDTAPPSMHRIVTSLEEKGLLTRRRDEEDARFVYIHLTEEGRARTEKAIAAVAAVERTALQSLSGSEVVRFRKTLVKLLEISATAMSDKD